MIYMHFTTDILFQRGTTTKKKSLDQINLCLEQQGKSCAYTNFAGGIRDFLLYDLPQTLCT
jgi:hypothetical protein